METVALERMEGTFEHYYTKQEKKIICMCNILRYTWGDPDMKNLCEKSALKLFKTIRDCLTSNEKITKSLMKTLNKEWKNIEKTFSKDILLNISGPEKENLKTWCSAYIYLRYNEYIQIEYSINYLTNKM